QALADKLETPGDGERCGGEDNCVERFEEFLAKNLTDVNRRRGKEHAFVAALKPVHVIPFIGFEQEGKLLADFKAAARDARQLLRALRQRGKFGLKSFERVQQGVVGFLVLREEGFALLPSKGKAAVARRKTVEKEAALFADALRAAKQGRGTGAGKAHGL